MKNENLESYLGFLQSKIKIAEKTGFEIPEDQIHPILFGHQKDQVLWALKGGCRALFNSFGLGKTMMQLELMRQCSIKTEKPVLIVCPLGVRHEFIRDGKKMERGLENIKYITNTSQLDENLYYITNYERIRKGDIDPTLFGAVTFDEASILRGLATETVDVIMSTFKSIHYRFVCTATPSPNRFLELTHYAEYLGIMDRGLCLTTFFQRDSTTAGNLTLLERRKKEFWYWMSSWATFITKPSDLGYDDTGYDLPPIKKEHHLVKFDRGLILDKFTNQTSFLAKNSSSLSESSKEKRDSLQFRVAKILEITSKFYKFVDNFQIDNNNEKGPKGIQQNFLRETQRGNATEGEVVLSKQQRENRQREEEGIHVQLSEKLSEEKINSRTDRSKEFEKEGNVCNESRIQGKAIGDSKTEQIEESREENEFPFSECSRNDINGFQRHIGTTEGGLWDLRNGEIEQESEETLCGSLPQNWKNKGNLVSILQFWIGELQRQYREFIESGGVPEQIVIWCHQNPEQRLVEYVLKECGISVASISGSETFDEREQLLIDWKDKKYTILLSKPVILGSGMNLQQSCKMIFAGIDYKFNDFIQAIHREYRFGQEKQVEVHIIFTDAEDDILKKLELKWHNHTTLQTEMTDIIKQHGLNADIYKTQLQREFFENRKEFKGNNFHAINNDSTFELPRIASNSVGLVHTSIPFGNHYEYSENFNCFGHNSSNEEFFKQMDFLIPEIYRVLEPGRIAAIHVKDRIRYSYQNGYGFTDIMPFSDDTNRAFIKHGFSLISRITITTDVVRENNQTYRLGYTEMCKDGSKMGAGLPEYLLLFRKPATDKQNAYADTPVVKDKNEHSVGRWQIDAHDYWKSSGNTLFDTDTLKRMEMPEIIKAWEMLQTHETYNYGKHVGLNDKLDSIGKLPRTFMALQPKSNNEEVWDDVTRMNTLNSAQSRKNLVKHICPLQIDIVARVIERYSMKGETILDPFGGIMTVPVVSAEMGRYGIGIELNESYWNDGCSHLKLTEVKQNQLELF